MTWIRPSTCGRCFHALRPIGSHGLDLPVSAEELVKYWKGQVDAFFDATNGTIVVRARAFTRQDALTLAEGILAASERLVNELSARARRDTLRTAKEEVGRAERRLKSALTQLRDFRDREGLIDPRKTADATSALAGRVRDELVRADTELSTLKHYMREDAPSVKMLEARIQSLEAQRRSVESEVTDTERTRSEALSRVMGSYEQLEAERTFAENAYQHALQAARPFAHERRPTAGLSGQFRAADLAREGSLSASGAVAHCRVRNCLWGLGDWRLDVSVGAGPPASITEGDQFR